MSDIHDLFHRAAPPEPPTQGWANKARAKRTRRQATLGGVAAVAVLAIAVPLTLHFTDDGPSVALPPAETASPTPEQTIGPEPEKTQTYPEGFFYPENLACLSEWDRPREAGPGPVTTGATQVWLCGDAVVTDVVPREKADPAKGRNGTPSGSRGPMEPLTLNPDELVAAYLNAPEADPMAACTEEYSLTYRLVFEYPDKEPQVVRGELHGCRTATDGDTVREGGKELYDAAIAAWTEQRRSTADTVEPVPVSNLDCDIAGTLLPVDLDELRVALVCDFELVSIREPQSIEELIDAVREGGEPFPDDYVWPDEPTGRSVNLLNDFSDALVLTEIREGEFEFFHDGDLRLFRASPELIEHLKTEE
ncbi:hypothetical protein [Tessaracoccus caeni]|uniref:hypothetical protein n=1 Tax=Tessaracoccus caeni TaxID=3031239 RepID=UPI0023DBE262|nr:hypothetical protein [Tessaracoccus caeni]MDF1487534.1 hypothetical protein [Tessaracoccus caeni]